METKTTTDACISSVSCPPKTSLCKRPEETNEKALNIPLLPYLIDIFSVFMMPVNARSIRESHKSQDLEETKLKESMQKICETTIETFTIGSRKNKIQHRKAFTHNPLACLNYIDAAGVP
ncbi:hypothetical protein Tco_0104178 [Tanacetum coccineum]